MKQIQYVNKKQLCRLDNPVIHMTVDTLRN
jgi:hypothetical protein